MPAKPFMRRRAIVFRVILQSAMQMNMQKSYSRKTFSSKTVSTLKDGKQDKTQLRNFTDHRLLPVVRPWELR